MTPGMRLVMICLSAGGWAVTFGLGSQVTTHWLRDHGVSDTAIGVMHALYYLGVALASLVVHPLAGRWGSRCSLLGMLLSGLTLILFPWVVGLGPWLGLRFLAGVGCALSLIPLETLVSRGSDIRERSRNFGYYGLALTLGGAVGISLGLTWLEPGDPQPFWGGGIIALIAALLILTVKAETSKESRPEKTHLAWRDNALSFATAWGQGFLEGGLLAFLALYLESQGLTTDQAGLLMGVTMAGVILCQVPVAWLGDRLGRRRVLLGCYALVMAALMLVPWSDSLPGRGFWLFVLGAGSGAMYPLGLSLLGDKIPESALPRAYGIYLAIECVGSQLGAAAMGRARDLWGGGAMFAVGIAGLGLALLAWGSLPRPRKEDVTNEERTRRAA